jgi:hypothetical protein
MGSSWWASDNQKVDGVANNTCLLLAFVKFIRLPEMRVKREFVKRQ